MMDTLLGLLISFGLIINVIFTLRERNSGRIKEVLFIPLLISFSLLFVGYSILNLIASIRSMDLDTYRTSLSLIFSLVLMIYLVQLFRERRRVIASDKK